MTSWLGLDVGTSSLKALMVDSDGTVLARASVPYDQPRPRQGLGSEQNPQMWVDAATRAIDHCVSIGGYPNGIGLAGQVPTIVLVDKFGDAVRPALTWQDNRAVDEARYLEEVLGPLNDYIGMNLPWSASHLPAKMRWLALHEPDSLHATEYVSQPKDFLGMKLTGSPMSDAWSMKGLVNIRTGEPVSAVFDECGWSTRVCPPVELPWLPRGLTQGGALGLPAGIPVSIGWSDALASMLSIGAFSESKAFIFTGTSEIVGMSTDEDVDEVSGLYRVPKSCAPRSVLYGPTQSSGSTTGWLSKLFGHPVEELMNIAGRAKSHNGPTFVPYIDGERAPLWDPDLRAIFSGIGISDGAPELIRSVLLGIALSASNILDLASANSNTPVSEVHLAGREINTEAWKSLRLESLGVPLYLYDEPFTAALGAAMLGAAAAMGGDLKEADSLRATPTRVDPTSKEIAFSKVALVKYRKASQLARAWSNQ